MAEKNVTTITQEKDQTMPKPKQSRRELKKKDSNEAILAFPGGETPTSPSSENDPKALVPPDGTQVPTVDPSSEGVTVHPESTTKKGGKKKGTEKPQDAPGTSSEADQGGTAIQSTSASQGILEALSDEEVIEREQLEYEVEQGIDATFKVASALLTIREKRLYRSTHSTYEEYIEDRWQVSSRRARHLTFAASVMKSLEEAGVTELPTNESQVRGLQGVVEADHAKVWEEATQAAKKKGKDKPGRKEVQEAASKVGRPKGTKNQPKPSSEQKKVLQGIQNGTIPLGTQPVISQVDEGVDAAMVADIDLPDAEWLAQFPIRDQLNEYCRTLFDQEVLFYRWFAPHRKPLVRDVTQKLAAEVRRVAKRVGPYVSRIERALSLADPRTWKVCASCKGTGVIDQVGACSDCKNAGYRLG